MQPPDKNIFTKFFVSPLKEIYYSSFFRALLLAGVIVAALALVELNFLPSLSSTVRVGKPSPKTIKAKKTTRVTDYDATEARRRRAAASVNKVYFYDARQRTAAEKKAAAVYRRLLKILGDKDVSAEAKRKSVNELIAGDLNQRDLAYLSKLPANTLKSYQKNVVDITLSAMKKKIKESELAEERRRAYNEAENLNVAPAAAKLIGETAAASLRADYFVDIGATNRLIKEKLSQVKPVKVTKQKGEIIVQEGKIVTANQYKTLRDLGLIRSVFANKIGRIMALALGALLLIALSLTYLYEFKPAIYHSNRLLLLLTIIVMGILLIGKGITPFAPSILIPVAAVSMLATILIDFDVGVIMGVVTGLFLSFIVKNSYEFLFFAIVSGLAGAYLTAHISYRSDLTKAGFWMMAITAFLALIVGLLRSLAPFTLLVYVGWGVIGGFFATMLTIAGTQFLEYAFNVTTDMKLLELANPTQKLLKELMMVAPGTYNHSIVTGNLAESAAESVGANPLLTRVGAYYHDIGKIRRPYFFIENQRGDNPHDKTKPNLSCLIITAHVKEGVELAVENHLPKEIVDIIRQHHGTSLVSFFYNRARELEKKGEVNEDEYRYPGEKPRSREAALVMLADAAEAATRTIAKPTPAKIEQLIKKLFQAKLEDGQLDESDLTLGDLDVIAKIYARTLANMYHQRIEYSACELPRRKKGTVAGNLIKQSVRRSSRIAGS